LIFIRDINIEELLGRPPVVLNDDEIERFLLNKTIMVTGGGGSIGSELCRQIAKIKINKLIIVDIYENNAYDIQQELSQCYGEQLILKIEIASIRDKKKMYQLLERHRPNIIFHAAAHKHVPLMEECPDEAILNNIIGTNNLVQAAKKYGVDKFVLISTDKAVNPTSIMGASKRFCEMLLQSMRGSSKTEFVAVRFGNVLGSNGSVIPLFLKQIAQGGPVTITDKRIVRYFMTITEAAQLVLQTGAMANSSEVYVLDMGEPIKIIELAENLIRLTGNIPYTEIPIVETGLRPGEKLYEELLMNNEELIATQNNKIFIEHQNKISKKEINKKMKILKKALRTKSSEQIYKAMKMIVPNYKDPKEVNSIID
jgi:FlaA1/EpsC-like NDP-sugar epimerase